MAVTHQLESIFGEGKIFIGVVHLPPLPGSPRWGGDMGRVLEQAQREAQVLEDGGANGIIVENFGDAPFRIGRVEPDTVAALTLAVDRVHRVVSVPVGINVLRNDAASALTVAAATGAQFIRVNIHYGVMAADEGLVEGEAYATLRHRQALGANVKILADVLVKHAVPLGPVDLRLMARETAYRGLADGLIVTGPVTGQPALPDDVATVRQAVPDRLLLVGSGVGLDNAHQLLERANGAIVGTSLKREGIVSNPLDPERVRRMANAIHAIPY
jgi:membrane complex biogenesis BtpA family protein